MGIVILLIVMFVTANVWHHTEELVFWTYLATLVLSYFASFYVAGSLEQYQTPFGERPFSRSEGDPQGRLLSTLLFIPCYLVICGGATGAIWYGVPWLNVLVAVAVGPGWLLLSNGIAGMPEDSGRQVSTTHEVVHARSRKRVGDASVKQVYEHKHGHGSWARRERAGRTAFAWFCFLAIAGVLGFFGFYEAIGVLTVVAILRAIFS